MIKERDIENLWGKYEKFVKMTDNENFISFVDNFGQRIVECSFSQRDKEPFCGVAGLVEYSLELLKNAKNIATAIGYEFTTQSLVKTCFLTELGRIGTFHEDRLVVCTSDWHKEKLGQYYDWNEECEKYNIQDMSLFHAQRERINLSWEEWQAIHLSRDFTSDENRFYSGHRNRLSIIINLAKQVTLKNEFDKIKGIYTVPF